LLNMRGRNRHADTNLLLAALNRIESNIHGERMTPPVDRIRLDLLEMAKSIARTKAEIAEIRSGRERRGKFGEPVGVLDLMIRATEAATSDILAAAEQVQEIASTLREQGLHPESSDMLDSSAKAIYLACSFQDLTDERTRKVIQALGHLEGRINAMIDVCGPRGDGGRRCGRAIR
jgi:hypothetical protein